MKKVIMLSMLIIILFNLTGCITTIEKYKFPYEYDEVESMEIYSVEWIDMNNISEFDNIDPLAIIDSNDYKYVMESIEDMEFKMIMLIIAAAPGPKYNYYGYALYVTYKNGSKSIIANSLRCDYDSKLQIYNSQHYGSSATFDELMEMYIQN